MTSSISQLQSQSVFVEVNSPFDIEIVKMKLLIFGAQPFFVMGIVLCIEGQQPLIAVLPEVEAMPAFFH